MTKKFFKSDYSNSAAVFWFSSPHCILVFSYDETSSEAHKWFAIVLGSRGEYLGIKEKILDGFEFKRHIDRAAELAPQDHTIRHLLGR